MTTNFERFVEFNGVLQEWKVLRDEKDAEQVENNQSLFLQLSNSRTSKLANKKRFMIPPIS